MKKDAKRVAVYVEWLDASYEDADCKPDDFDGLVPCHVLGWLVREDDKRVDIAMEFHPETNTWRHVCHIPKVLVTKMKKISVKV